MWTVRELLEIVLLMANEIGEGVIGCGSFRDLEERSFRVSQDAARRLLMLACASLDKQMLAEREKSRLKPVHRKRRRLLTWFGEVELERWYYRDRETGESGFLLDEALGLAPRQRLSPLVREHGIAFAVEMPYRRAAARLKEATLGAVEVSAMELWEAVQASGAAAKDEAEAQRQAVFEAGEVPPGVKRVPWFNVEVDGVCVPARAAQGERERLELKLAVGYEGKEQVGPQRRRLVGRRVHAGVAAPTAFFEETVADFGQRWDLAAIEHCSFGSDGAGWAKKGCEYFPQSTFRLDRYHLRRELRRGLGHDAGAYGEVCAAIAAASPWSKVASILATARQRYRGKRRERVERLHRYLANNWEGIRADATLQELGAIEGQVFHHIARRMKRHGARWSPRGADHLGRLLSAHANGELDQFTRCCWSLRPKQQLNLTSKTFIRHDPADGSVEDLAAWLRARMPALQGPHADHLWIKHVLRRLAEAGVEVA